MERSKSDLRLDLRAKGVSAVATFNTLDRTVLDLISITRRSYSIEDSNNAEEVVTSVFAIATVLHESKILEGSNDVASLLLPHSYSIVYNNSTDFNLTSAKNSSRCDGVVVPLGTYVFLKAHK